MIDESMLQRWEKYVEDFIVSDLERAIGADNLQTGLLIVAFSDAEALSGFYVGQEAKKETFAQFLMDELYFPNSAYRSQIWLKDTDKAPNFPTLLHEELRSKLIHDHVSQRNPDVPRFVLFREIHEPHLEWTKEGAIGFSVKRFVFDLLYAWDALKRNARTEKRYNAIEARWGKLRGLSVDPDPQQADIENAVTRGNVLHALLEEQKFAQLELKRQQAEHDARMHKLSENIEKLQSAERMHGSVPKFGSVDNRGATGIMAAGSQVLPLPPKAVSGTYKRSQEDDPIL